MAKGELKKPQISKKLIFNKITPFDIYMYYVGRFPPNESFCNPLRGERNPSFIIGTKTGQWRHFDYGDPYWRGDCLDLVQQIYRCNYDDALKRIDKDFNLGLSDGIISDKKVITWDKPKIEIIPPPFFQILTRKFSQTELAWWNQYYQDISDLKREEVYAPYKIFRNRRLLPQKESLLTFCFYEPETDTWKLYRPDGRTDKGTPLNERKWDSNIPFTVVEGLSGIKNCRIAVLEKARKDRMVLKKALGTECVYSTQAEDPNCLTDETLRIIKENSEIQVIASDNDKKGTEFSWWLTTQHGYRHCNVPYNIPNRQRKGMTKDFAEWGRDYGLEVIYKHFESKGLI